mmetsp:Transcript_86723/g.193108  ORF Transcript_86723/g.193108 Transcript_86723/m.193108 type:complete len:300 (+) Transcript_86723:466-1365(+)
MGLLDLLLLGLRICTHELLELGLRVGQLLLAVLEVLHLFLDGLDGLGNGSALGEVGAIAQLLPKLGGLLRIFLGLLQLLFFLRLLILGLFDLVGGRGLGLLRSLVFVLGFRFLLLRLSLFNDDLRDLGPDLVIGILRLPLTPIAVLVLDIVLVVLPAVLDDGVRVLEMISALRAQVVGVVLLEELLVRRRVEAGGDSLDLQEAGHPPPRLMEVRWTCAGGDALDLLPQEVGHPLPASVADTVSMGNRMLPSAKELADEATAAHPRRWQGEGPSRHSEDTHGSLYRHHEEGWEPATMGLQ